MRKWCTDSQLCSPGLQFSPLCWLPAWRTLDRKGSKLSGVEVFDSFAILMHLILHLHNHPQSLWCCTMFTTLMVLSYAHIWKVVISASFFMNTDWSYTLVSCKSQWLYENCWSANWQWCTYQSAQSSMLFCVGLHELSFLLSQLHLRIGSWFHTTPNCNCSGTYWSSPINYYQMYASGSWHSKQGITLLLYAVSLLMHNMFREVTLL